MNETDMFRALGTSPCAQPKNMNLFGVPDGGESPKVRDERILAAKELCHTCVQKIECKEWAIGHPRRAGNNIWGETTNNERQRIRKDRRVAAERLACTALSTDQPQLNAPAAVEVPTETPDGGTTQDLAPTPTTAKVLASLAEVTAATLRQAS